jgi:hypothetical protein
MLHGNFGDGAMERATPTEPFVDRDAQGILVAGRSRFALDLFRSHIGEGAGHDLCPLRGGLMGNGGNAEVGEHHFMVSAQQHILRLHVTMNEALVMGVL